MMILLILNKTKSRSLSRIGGFTLLEVMIAVAVLAVTLTVLYGSQTQSLSLAAEAKFNTMATFLIEQKLAELDGGIVEPDDDEGDFGEEYPGFKWKIETEEAAVDDIEVLQDLEVPLKHIVLTVFWSESPFRHRIDYYVKERSGP